MQLLPSEPDIQTIVQRIERGDLDLQPDFQRGEVWSTKKKQKLIDSVLRNWYIPPIHTVVVKGSNKQDVLDGQQRLVAIRDFVSGHFTVDGYIAPEESMLKELDKLRYYELPSDVRRSFDSFTLRIIRISDYKPDEPGELFFRLNQVTSITAAEQRNAFYGPARERVKQLVSLFEDMGNNQMSVGFSNSRMSYDDVLGKLLCTLETRDLSVKLTASYMSERFRESRDFDNVTVDLATDSIDVFSRIRSNSHEFKLNKATLQTWLIVIATYISFGKANILLTCPVGLFDAFDKARNSQRSFFSNEYIKEADKWHGWEELALVFNDRSTSRVADISSVLYRDFIINFFLIKFLGIPKSIWPLNTWRLEALSKCILAFRHKAEPLEFILDDFLQNDTWGRFL